MKKTHFLFCIAILLSLTSCLSLAKNLAKQDSKIADTDINNLKSTKALFILRDMDLDEREKWEDAITSAWNFTEIDVISRAELKDYPTGNYSYFTLTGRAIAMQGRSTSSQSVYLFLKLMTYTGVADKMGDQETTSTEFWRQLLTPDFPTSTETASQIWSSNSVDNLYEGGLIRNWTPGLMKLYLIEAQRTLSNKTLEFEYKDMKDEEKLKQLKNETLYISDRVLINFNSKNGDESKRHNPDDLFKKYPYAYKIVAEEELSDLILNGTAKYVLDYVKANANVFVSIYDTSYGRIYQNQEMMTYNFKPKFVPNFIVK